MAAVSVENLSFTYAGAAAPALKRVSFRLEAGEFGLLFGRSGCGKSTLLRCLMPEIAPVGAREGAVHYLKCGEVFRHVDHTPEMLQQAIDESFGGDPYAMAEHYYSLVADVVRKTHADIIGHFDLVTKLNAGNRFFDEDNPRYIAAAISAVDELLKTGKPFEINTGAVSKGYRDFPYPSLRILKYIAQRGGSVILSSDSHRKDTLMFDFPKYEELARSLGLNVVTL